MIAFILALVLAALVGAWLRRRAARKDTRSGLNGDRPVFSVEPPARRMGSRKGERL